MKLNGNLANIFSTTDNTFTLNEIIRFKDTKIRHKLFIFQMHTVCGESVVISMLYLYDTEKRWKGDNSGNMFLVLDEKLTFSLYGHESSLTIKRPLPGEVIEWCNDLDFFDSYAPTTSEHAFAKDHISILEWMVENKN